MVLAVRMQLRAQHACNPLDGSLAQAQRGSGSGDAAAGTLATVQGVWGAGWYCTFLVMAWFDYMSKLAMCLQGGRVVSICLLGFLIVHKGRGEVPFWVCCVGQVSNHWVFLLGVTALQQSLAWVCEIAGATCVNTS